MSLSLKSQDFCYYTSSKYQCEMNTDLQVPCGEDMCAKSKTLCKEYQGWYYIIKQLRHKKLREKQTKVRKVFDESIKICPKYSWNKTSVCLNNHRCYYKQSVPIKMMFDTINYVKLVTCPCQGKHGYKCGRDYCAENKASCDGLIWKNAEEGISKGIENCSKIK